MEKETLIKVVPPPYWCPVCKKEVYATVRGGGGRDNRIVCNRCLSEDISSNEDGISEVWNPSRR